MLSLLELRHHSAFPALAHQSSWFLGLWTPELTPVAPGFSAFQTWTELCHWLSYLADGRMWDFSASITT